MRLPWVAWLVFGAVSCGRTEPLLSPLIASVTPQEQTVTQGERASWRGTAFSEDAPPPTFGWRVLSQPTASRAGLNSAGPEAHLRPDQPGTWTIELQAAAAGRESQRAIALLHVQPSLPGNRAPVADAGLEQRISLGQRVMLDGTRSFDPDGDALRYEWSVVTAPASVMLSSPDVATPSLTPSVSGRFEFVLRVTDPFGATDVATVAIEVLPLDAGVADAGPLDAGVDAGLDAGPPGPDTLDANEISLVGTLTEGLCTRKALTRLFMPNVASVGFDCGFDADSAVVRPTDGRLIYRNLTEDFLRAYSCDECSWRGVYPPTPLANDTVIPTPCPAGDRLSGFSPGGPPFLVSPDGEILHRCLGSLTVWRDAMGSTVHTDPASTDLLRGLGRQGWAISRTQVVNWRTGASAPIVGFPPVFGMLTVRWSPPDAFNVVIHMTPTSLEELWRVTLDGNAQRIGAYTPLPPNTLHTENGRLDSSGRFFHLGREIPPGSAADLVLQRELGAPSRIVFSDATNPLIKVDGPGLVTGP